MSAALDDEWQRGKQAHIELSDAAAEIYDDSYEADNFATASYMNYEIRELRKLVAFAPDNKIAVDLGCGTGRHSFMLAEHFSLVYGYDISPRMIARAESAKLERGIGNVRFEISDVEEEVPSIGPGKADLISCSFGMGSFVRELQTLFKTVRLILKPAGVVAFSWYNSEGIVNSLSLPWIPALAAKMVPGSDKLRVEFAGEVKEISAVAYTASKISHELKMNFASSRVTTYPTLTALFPQELFVSEQAQMLCRIVDEKLMEDTEGAASGHYIFATATKRGKAPRTVKLGYERVEELLRWLDIHPRRHEHAPFRTMAEVKEHFTHVNPDCMVKSVLMAKQRGARADPENDDLVLCLVAADRQVDSRKLAKFLGLETSSHLHMLSPIDLEERTGFSLGAIPPFGMPKRVQVIMDSEIAAQSEIWTGSGKATESFQLSMDELMKLSMASVAVISKSARR